LDAADEVGHERWRARAIDVGQAAPFIVLAPGQLEEAGDVVLIEKASSSRARSR
jgi:hypothetical protein